MYSNWVVLLKQRTTFLNTFYIIFWRTHTSVIHAKVLDFGMQLRGIYSMKVKYSYKCWKGYIYIKNWSKKNTTTHDIITWSSLKPEAIFFVCLSFF